MTPLRSAARLLRRVLATVPLVAALVLLGPATSAQAHAYLTASNPADGATLAAAPRTLQLHFSESVDLPATRLEIVDARGRHFPATRLRIVRGEDAEEPSRLVADLPPLPRGVYRVSWETLSTDDLHRTSGVLAFGVGRPAARAAFVEPLPHGEELVLRWSLFLFIAAALGGLLGARLVRGADRAVRTCLRLGLAGAGSGLAAAAALLADQVSGSGESLGRLMSGSYGLRWSVRELGLALLLLAIVLTLRGRRRLVPALVAAGAGAVGVGSALLGHAASSPGPAATRVAADALHLLAAATWVGTVLVVGGAVARRTVAPGRALRAFAAPAAACVSVVVATGVYLASGVVGSVDAALFTWYGRALLAKTALFAVVAALGLANHRRLRRAGLRPGAWTLTAEAVVGVLVLGLAAFLTSGQPAREPEFVATGRPAPVAFVDGRVADLQESVRLAPNRPGRNVVVLDVLDTRRPAPAPIERVLVRTVDGATGAAPVAAQPLAIRGRWSATVTVAAPGRVGIEVTVLRAGLRPVRHVFGWVVAGASAGPHPARVSTAPAGDALRTLAALVAAALGVAWLVAARVRARRRRLPGVLGGRPGLGGQRPLAGPGDGGLVHEARDAGRAEVDLGPPAEGAAGRDRAAARLRDGADDGQPEPAAAARAGRA